MKSFQVQILATESKRFENQSGLRPIQLLGADSAQLRASGRETHQPTRLVSSACSRDSFSRTSSNCTLSSVSNADIMTTIFYLAVFKAIITKFVFLV